MTRAFLRFSLSQYIVMLAAMACSEERVGQRREEIDFQQYNHVAFK